MSLELGASSELGVLNLEFFAAVLSFSKIEMHSSLKSLLAISLPESMVADLPDRQVWLQCRDKRRTTEL